MKVVTDPETAATLTAEDALHLTLLMNSLQGGHLSFTDLFLGAQRSDDPWGGAGAGGINGTNTLITYSTLNRDTIQEGMFDTGDLLPKLKRKAGTAMAKSPIQFSMSPKEEAPKEEAPKKGSKG